MTKFSFLEGLTYDPTPAIVEFSHFSLAICIFVYAVASNWNCVLQD